MAIDQKLLEKARRSSRNLTYKEAQTLAEQLGFIPVGGRGSHTVYRHPQGQSVRKEFRPLNLQEGYNGKAKPYQVGQMLEMAEAMGLITPER